MPINATDNLLHVGLTARLLLAGVLAVLTNRRATARLTTPAVMLMG